MTSFYDILGVAPTASAEEIKTAFRRMANQFHPDKTPGANEAVQDLLAEKFKEVREAYDTLIDSDKRALYDAALEMLRSEEYYQAEHGRKDRETAEAERRAAEQAETERLAREKAEAERFAEAKAARERLLREQAEANRRAAERAQAADQQLNRAMYVVFGLGGLAVLIGAFWYFSPSGFKQERQQTQQVQPREPSPPVTQTANDRANVPAQPQPLPQERAPEVQSTPQAVKVNPQDGLNYVWIPPGTFMMGCSPGDTDCPGDDTPPHIVTLSDGFWLGQTEVTVSAYKRFARSTRRQMPDAPAFNGGWAIDNMPIVNVTWDQAKAYCTWVGGLLPTEAEWEFAARGGSTEARYGPLDDIAWYSYNSGGKAHAVAQKHPNGFGLYDMLGNVGEWVNDWYDWSYYQNSPSDDPAGPANGSEVVLRGGSFWLESSSVRVSDRGRGEAAGGYGDSTGFRCAAKVVSP